MKGLKVYWQVNIVYLTKVLLYPEKMYFIEVFSLPDIKSQIHVKSWLLNPSE
jgi:hypothetical protein